MFTAFRLLLAAGLVTISLTASPVVAAITGAFAGVNLATVVIDQFDRS